MIEKMKTVCIVVQSQSKSQMLNELRNAGVLHVKTHKNADQRFVDKFSDLTRKRQILSEYPTAVSAKAGEKVALLTKKEFEALNESVSQKLEEKKTLLDKRTATNVLFESLKSWGEFNPEDLKNLEEQGIRLFFYRLGKKELLSLNEEVKYIRLGTVDKMETIAVVGSELPANNPASKFEMPAKGPGQLAKDIHDFDVELEECEKVLSDAAKQLASYDYHIQKCSDEVKYSSVSRSAEEDGSLCWVTGYLPAVEAESFKTLANQNGWGYMMSDPQEDDDQVPTKVKYSKVSALIKPVFDLLGTVPGYREYDISLWFLVFFALFFAMIVGDAAYGCIFLLIGVLLNIKQKKVTTLTLLLYVLALATIVWGAMTGTWFGFESAMDIPLLRKLVIPSIANYPAKFGVDSISAQNQLMKLCFSIGTIQLSLGCVLAIIRKLKEKNLSFIADVGWLIGINALYYVVLLLVVGENVSLGSLVPFIICCFVLVVLFGCQAPGLGFIAGLKAGAANAFTTFINTISAFGNIMSYIRLFAVGLASLAIAQSFDGMAAGFTGFAMPLGLVVLIIGHALNLVMGLLSVVVHGVRLNILEFSGQLGMEWSGISYEPFRKTVN